LIEIEIEFAFTPPLSFIFRDVEGVEAYETVEMFE